MKAITMAALACLAACATGTAAQTTENAGNEPAAVAACLAARLDDDRGDGARRCVGEAARACGRAMGDGGETTAGLVICAARERQAWRALLEQGAAALREREHSAQTALLEQALTRGEAWEQARCAYEASMYEGGSLAGVVSAHCLRDTTAERAIDLQRRLREYEQR
jgi:uncharacterized protein YecT (DUF1311 family)